METMTRSRARKGCRILVLGVVAITLASACASGEKVPPLERRAQEINRAIMCPVCPGESIDQSQHELAVQMRAIVDDKLKAGWTEPQIKDFFVDRYGPSVLLEPPRRGFNAIVWLVPPVGLALAGLVLFSVLRSMIGSRSSRGAPLSGESELSEQDRELYFARVEVALEEGTSVEEGGESSDAGFRGAG